MSDNSSDTRTWPELSIGLYYKLTGRDAQISYTFDDFELSVPSAASQDAAHALWKMNGTLKISTSSGSEGN